MPSGNAVVGVLAGSLSSMVEMSHASVCPVETIGNGFHGLVFCCLLHDCNPACMHACFCTLKCCPKCLQHGRNHRCMDACAGSTAGASRSTVPASHEGPATTQASSRQLTVAEQVDLLLRQATSLDNLSRMFEGWMPWI